MSKKQDIIDTLTQPTSEGRTMLTDPNHWGRRFFRCWLDGSYTGEEFGNQITREILKRQHDWVAMRSFVVGQFAAFIAHEFDCSESVARSAVKSSFTDFYREPLYLSNVKHPGTPICSELSHLNELLIEECRERVHGMQGLS